MNSLFKKVYIFIFLAVSPTIALAQGAPDPCPAEINNAMAVLNLLGCIITKSVIPLLVLLSVVVFIFGVVKYIGNAGDSKNREEGRNFMIYGIVALFVMVSVWGFVSILQGTFGLSNSVLIPQLQGLQSSNPS